MASSSSSRWKSVGSDEAEGGRWASCASLARELKRIQQLKTALLQSFNNEEFQSNLQAFLDSSELADFERFSQRIFKHQNPFKLAAFRGGDQLANSIGFRSLFDKTSQEALNLSRAQVAISVVGEPKVGKTTLCNVLLGERLLISDSAPCTSAATVVSSGTPLASSSNSTIFAVFFVDSLNLPQLFLEIEAVSSTPTLPLPISSSASSASSASTSPSPSSSPASPAILHPVSSASSPLSSSPPPPPLPPPSSSSSSLPSVAPSILSPPPSIHLSSEYFSAKQLLLDLHALPPWDSDADPRLKGARVITDPLQFAVLCNLPPPLRDRPVVAKIQLVQPVLGMSESGISIADCPGLYESASLNDTTFQIVQASDIILYVCSVDRPPPSDHNGENMNFMKTVRFLRKQVANGAEVLFLCNVRRQDTPSSVARVESIMRSTYARYFPDSFTADSVHIFDFDSALSSNLNSSSNSSFPNSSSLDLSSFHEMQRVLCAALQQRAKQAVFQFSHIFNKLLRAQYIITSRFIGQTVRHAGLRPANPLPAKRSSGSSNDTATNPTTSGSSSSSS
ncbi:MAG: hypothetical protein Q8P67_23580, partial [archaeon]|nr:hypothetical protein [archaeon]